MSNEFTQVYNTNEELENTPSEFEHKHTELLETYAVNSEEPQSSSKWSKAGETVTTVDVPESEIELLAGCPKAKGGSNADAPEKKACKEPHWFENGKEIGKGAAAVEVTTDDAANGGEGQKVNLETAVGNRITAIIGCTVKFTGSVSNPAAGAGTDSITSFSGACKATPACAAGNTLTGKTMPWPSALVPGVNDELKNIRLEVRCGAAVIGTWEGKLSPVISDTAANGELQFKGFPSGGLGKPGSKERIALNGNVDFLGKTKKEAITVRLS